MDHKKFTEILEKHRKWLHGEEDGERADLQGEHLEGAFLRLANLRGADLREADLQGASLRWTDLREADLRGTDLRGADLRGANLQNIQNKKIMTFQFNKHFAYCCDGYITIGYETKTIDEWMKKYEKLGKYNNYTNQEIQEYGKFINNCAVINFE